MAFAAASTATPGVVKHPPYQPLSDNPILELWSAV